MCVLSGLQGWLYVSVEKGNILIQDNNDVIILTICHLESDNEIIQIQALFLLINLTH